MEPLTELEKITAELTEVKKREQELKKRVEDLTDFIENGALPLHWVDGEGIIIWANKAELDSLGYTKDEYIGHHIAEFHADRPVIEDILTRLTNKETLNNYPAKLKAKDGSIKHVLINSNVRWDGEKFIHTRCFTRDISDLKQEQERREQLLKELEGKNIQLQFAFEDMEVKVKFRNEELEKELARLREENKKLKEVK